MATGDLCVRADVKSWLNIAFGNTTDDALIDRMISSCSAQLQAQIGRTIASTAYVEVYSGTNDRFRRKVALNVWMPSIMLSGEKGYAINLRNRPVTAVTQVLVDGQEIPARPALTQGDPNNALVTGGYVLIDEDRLEISGPEYEFTSGIGNIQISYTAGFTTTPKDIEDAVIQWVGWLYRSRDRIGQTTKSLAGETISFAPEEMPPYTRAVIEAWRTVRV